MSTTQKQVTIKRRKYPSDISKNGWKQLKKILPQSEVRADKRGRPRSDLREVINAIFYVVKSGCTWRSLPHDLPPWPTCYGYFRSWAKNGTWQMINTHFVKKVRRKRLKRKARPTAASIDSQSVKTSICGGFWRGFDAGKKVNGRKRFILTDSEGLLLAVWICAASVSEKLGAMQLLRFIRMSAELRQLCGRIKLIWADGGYRGKEMIQYAKDMFNWIWTIIQRNDQQKGFKLLPRRWVVERTFAWISNCRRLAKDYEKTRHSSQSVVYIAMIIIMINRLN